jgi:hypothetical protein
MSSVARGTNPVTENLSQGETVSLLQASPNTIPKRSGQFGACYVIEMSEYYFFSNIPIKSRVRRAFGRRNVRWILVESGLF